MNEKEQPASARRIRDEGDGGPESGPARELPPAARRALAEADARRTATDKARAESGQRPKELGGQDGPEPTRYGDWEKGGIVSDF
jgi:hypothetical protein